MNSRRWYALIMVGLSIGLIDTSCGPKISKLEIWPRQACLDDTVHVSFDVRGQGNVLVIPRGSGASRETTAYVLVVDGVAEPGPPDVVRWRLPQDTLRIETRRLSADSLIAVDSNKYLDWKNSGLSLIAISSISGRAIHISHAGIESLLPADGTPSMAFNTVPVYGKWECRAALLPGEVMGDPKHAAPGELDILEIFTCSNP